jgi:Na+/proline symporter
VTVRFSAPLVLLTLIYILVSENQSNLSKYSLAGYQISLSIIFVSSIMATLSTFTGFPHVDADLPTTEQIPASTQ